jgi:hypothetical protein
MACFRVQADLQYHAWKDRTTLEKKKQKEYAKAQRDIDARAASTGAKPHQE